MNIVLLEPLGVPEEVLNLCVKPLLEGGHTFRSYPKSTDPQVQIDRAKDADVIMIANMPLTGEVIAACPNLKLIDVAFTGVDHVDLEALMERLGAEQIDSVLLEGGGTLNWAALESGIVQRVQAYIAPKLFGGADAKSPVAGTGVELPAQAVQLQNTTVTQIGPDFLLESEVVGHVYGNR